MKEKPRDCRVPTTVRISLEGHDALLAIAAAERVKINDLLIEGVQVVLERRGKAIKLGR